MEITSVEQLVGLYGSGPRSTSLRKETDRITTEYRELIEAAPFCVLATSGPGGLDASPRGDRGGLVTVVDPRTVLLPDRKGNQRLDSLRNVLHDPRVALFFLLPGLDYSVRVNGRATITAEPMLLDQLAVDGRHPLTVLRIEVETVLYQCARAALRAQLWDPDAHLDGAGLPTCGDVLDAITEGELGGASYDAELADRLPKSLW